jgi:transcriptional regulator with XRE-family HTH domain
MKKLSSILSHLMSQKGIKSAELARKTGIGQPIIYRLMTGETENPQISTLKPIADFFQIGFDELLGLAPLKKQHSLHTNVVLNELNNKLMTIKTIAITLVDALPTFTNGYQMAVSANLINEEISLNLLPLILLNNNNLLKTINQAQQILTENA